MIRIMIRACFLALFLTSPTLAADRPADEIVRQIDALQVPPKPVDSNKADAQTKIELIGELHKLYPKDQRLARLLPQRWELLINNDDDNLDTLLAELDAALLSTEDPTIKVEAAYYKAEVVLEKHDGDPAACSPAVEAFIKLAPKDKRAAMQLYLIAYNEPDTSRRVEIENRVLKNYSDPQVIEMIEGDRRQRDKVGQPFELRFADAISGKAVSMEQFRGKVVVVDFWATWCGPCVDVMPKMKAIHDRYKEKGVEFIGISLDREGALPKLKQFVADHQIPWPQHFEGKRFDSDLVRRWNISSIPTVFVVDKDGKLASVKGVLGLEATLDGLLQDQAK
jgi:thiol-disulfide isomerase/thioredoxin